MYAIRSYYAGAFSVQAVFVSSHMFQAWCRSNHISQLQLDYRKLQEYRSQWQKGVSDSLSLCVCPYQISQYHQIYIRREFLHQMNSYNFV